MVQQLPNAIYHLIRALRPRQYIKNISLFAAITFWGALFNPEYLLKTIEAFAIFCLLSSGAYLMNDVHDINRDRRHPYKKNRPFASGKISIEFGLIIAFIFILSGLIFAYFINSYFLTIASAFTILQIFYTFFLRKIIILDALTVAFAFILRVFAGALATQVPISSWLILATVGLSLLLAFGKRRSERTLLSNCKQDLKTRNTLEHYPDALLDATISMASSLATITYALFAFQVSPTTPILFGILPQTLGRPKWMMLTIPLVIYGIIRYLYVIYEKKEGESPERVILSDPPLLATIILWTVSVIVIIYGLERI